LKRWKAHGGKGASNSEAGRKVLKWQMVEVAKKGRESCKGSGKVFGESMLLERKKADCARRSRRCVD